MNGSTRCPPSSRPKGRERGHFLLEQLLEQARQEGIDMPFSATTGYVNTIEPQRRGALPRQPGDRGAPARLHALERDGDGGQGQPAASRQTAATSAATSAPSPRWPPCSAPASTISGMPRAKTTAATALHPGPQLARHLRPRLPGRPPDRRAAAELPPGSGRQGPVQLSAPQADARVLAVPDRVDGPGPADGDLPGALPEVPARPRHRQHREPQGLGVLRRRRDGRARNRWAPSAWPRARSWTT